MGGLKTPSILISRNSRFNLRFLLSKVQLQLGRLFLVVVDIPVHDILAEYTEQIVEPLGVGATFGRNRIENSGFVNSRIDGIKKSSMFWLARMIEESFRKAVFCCQRGSLAERTIQGRQTYV